MSGWTWHDWQYAGQLDEAEIESFIAGLREQGIRVAKGCWSYGSTRGGGGVLSLRVLRSSLPEVSS